MTAAGAATVNPYVEVGPTTFKLPDLVGVHLHGEHLHGEHQEQQVT